MRNIAQRLGAMALFAALLTGISGIAFANPTGLPTLSQTYTVLNHPDSGFTGGSGQYWALDNITANLRIWNLGGNQYYVNETDTGTWCAPAGSLSPQAGTVQSYAGCGSINGGYSGTISSANAPTNAPIGSVNDGFSSTWITNSVLNAAIIRTGDVYSPGNAPSIVGSYYIPEIFGAGIDTSNLASNYGWTYTSTDGQTWVNSESGNSGDIVFSSASTGGVTATGTVIPLTCGLSVTPSSVAFGSIVPTKFTQAVGPVMVSDIGNVDGAVTVYGSQWSVNGNTQINSVGWTSINESWSGANTTSGFSNGLVLSDVASPTALGYLQPVSGSLKPGDPANYATLLNLLFGVTIPVNIGGPAQQTITLASSC